jgi:hypothetical protein
MDGEVNEGNFGQIVSAVPPCLLQPATQFTF